MSATDYQKLRQEISWDLAKRELGYEDHAPINIAQICVDRHADGSRAGKVALIHENHDGDIRQFTYRELKLLTNGWARFLRAFEQVAEFLVDVGVVRHGLADLGAQVLAVARAQAVDGD